MERHGIMLSHVLSNEKLKILSSHNRNTAIKYNLHCHATYLTKAVTNTQIIQNSKIG